MSDLTLPTLGCSGGTNPATKILLIQIELPTWRRARHWSYDWHLGIEEGFTANNVNFLTLASTWFNYAKKICGSKKFDQVWINDVVHLGCDEDVSESGLEWLASLASIRVGFITESVRYSEEEYRNHPHLKEYQRNLKRNAKYLTHVAAVDEADVAYVNRHFNLPAIWLPVPVPQRCITEHTSEPLMQKALFSGGLYGCRMNFLTDPKLADLLLKFSSPENRTAFPFLFDSLPMHNYYHAIKRIINIAAKISKKKRFGPFRPRLSGEERETVLPVDVFYSIYLILLRKMRRYAYSSYLQGLQAGCAVINLPSLFKGYASRVVEGMAAGRPVISWEIPDRPHTKNLFENDKEIVLFSKDSASHLADSIRKVITQPSFGNNVAANAQQKVRTYHTIEKRVKQILDWIATGNPPVYY